MIPALVAVAALCLAGAAFVAPRLAVIAWVLVLETAPDSWLDHLLGTALHETIIGTIKGFGLVLLAALAYRAGTRRDRFNPAFAFGFMFLTGLIHGLYPGLTVLVSVRSLIGSAAPFLFSFIRLPARLCRDVLTAVLWGPLAAVLFAAALAVLGLGQLWTFEQGALRLGTAGEPPYLAGFALIGIYAGLMAWLERPRPALAAALLANLLILLGTGGRAPLFIALFDLTAVLFIEGRVLTLAFGGALAAGAVLLAPWLGFVRIIGLANLGEAANLSHRDLVWPIFANALAESPVFGWGVGAGKVIIPYTSLLDSLLGTNAAHNEYLRIGAEGGVVGLVALIALIALWVRRGSASLPARPRWMLRVIFIGFAIHSLTDNTLIATTSSVFFLWASCIFAAAPNRTTPSP